MGHGKGTVESVVTGLSGSERDGRAATASAIVREDLAAIVREVGDEFHRLSGKTLLVTGGTGFIGSYLLETVAYLNDHVLPKACRLYAVTRHPRQTAARFPHLVGRPEFTVIEQDVRSLRLPSISWDFVIHAAAPSDAREYLKDPLRTAQTIVAGTSALLEELAKVQPQSMLFVSTGLVYGEQPAAMPALQEDYRGGPYLATARSCYAEAKRYAELLCCMHREQRGLPVCVARVFNLVGPRQNMNTTSAVADFIRQALDGDTIRIHDDGRAVRTYCYIAEAVAALWKLLLRHPLADLVNVGSDRDPVSFVELAHRISRVMAKSLRVTVEGAPPAGTGGRRYVPDLGRLYQLEGWKPALPLDEALLRTINWYREQASA